MFSARTLVLVAAVACALLFPQLLARVRGADGGASSAAAGQRSAAELADEALMDAMEASSRRDWVAAVRGYEAALAGGVPGVIGGGARAPTAKAAEAADAEGGGTAAGATAAAAAAPAAATRELRDGDGALNNLAIALSKAGRKAESAARFEQALAAGGEGAYKPMINLARARQSGGDRAGALRLYERVVALRPACEPHRSVGKKKAPAVAAEGGSGSGGGGGGAPANRGAGQGKAARKVTMGIVPLFCGAREPAGSGGSGGGGGGGQPGGGAEFLDAVRGSHLGAATLLLRSGGGGDSDSDSDSNSDRGSGSGAGASRVMRAELHLKAALKLSEDGEALLQMAALQERLGRAQLADAYLRRCLRHAAVERSLGAAEDEVAAEAGAKARAEVDGARAAATAKAGVAKAAAVAVVERDDFAAETAAAQQREQEALAQARVARDAARARGKAAAAGLRERAAFVEATCASRRAALLEEVQPALGSESGGSWRAEAVRLYEHALGVAPDFTAAATRLRALAKEDEDDAKLAELARRAAAATATDGAQAGEGAGGRRPA
jgi:hypothetical protein